MCSFAASGSTTFRRKCVLSAAVHGLCTPSTWALYSEYMAFVLSVHGLCTGSVRFPQLCFFRFLALSDKINDGCNALYHSGMPFALASVCSMGDSFSFKQFTVRQDRTAMKVGTDGVLLGAWARGGQRVLDVGCGTGVVALMMAQRFPEAEVTGIDIDRDASEQARQNACESPFAERVKVFNESLQSFGKEHCCKFDSIVCNPPFFARSLGSPDRQRSLARHDSSLPLSDLFRYAARLLTAEGEMSLVLPFDRLADARAEAVFAGLYEVRLCRVSTVEGKAPKRVLVAFGKAPVESVEQQDVTMMTSERKRSQWLSELTRDFYLDEK